MNPSPIADDGVAFEINPGNPARTRGGRNLCGLWGPYDQRPVQEG